MKIMIPLAAIALSAPLQAQPVTVAPTDSPVHVSWACKMTGRDGQKFDLSGKIDLGSELTATVSGPKELSGEYAVSQHRSDDEYELFKDHPGGSVDALYLTLGNAKVQDAILYITEPTKYGPGTTDTADKFTAFGFCSYDQKFFR